jgi:hypothetical protein
MLRQLGIVSITTAAVTLTLMAHPATAADPPPQLGVSRVIRGEGLTRPQFEALHDSATIEFRGTRITAGELRAKMRQSNLQRQAASQAAAAQAAPRFEAYRATFLQKQQAELQAASAKFQAELARLRQASASAPPPQHEGILNEAIQLQERAKTAPPAEQVQIEQRALQLHQQIQRLQQVPR